MLFSNMAINPRHYRGDDSYRVRPGKSLSQYLTEPTAKSFNFTSPGAPQHFEMLAFRIRSDCEECSETVPT